MRISVSAGPLVAAAVVALVGSPAATALPGAQDGAATNPSAAFLPTGCLSRSTREFWKRDVTRTWTPAARVATSPEQTPGRPYGAAFRARLVRAFGSEYGDYHRIVTLEMPDGCRRNFRADGFVAADRAFVDAALARHPTVPDKRHYRFAYVDGVATREMVASGKLRFKETPHFVIWYGVNPKGSFYNSIAYQHMSVRRMLKNIETSLEKSWYLSRDVVGAPMPFANDPTPRKLNVFLCGSGRPGVDGGDMESCLPNALNRMALPGDLTIGNRAYTHELTHMIQAYTGGFRGAKSDIGIWEIAAQWHTTTSGVNAYATGAYVGHLEQGPFAGLSRYAAHPFLAFLAENDDTHDLVYRAWTDNRRDVEGQTQENFVEAFVRLAGETGAYKKGYASFADDMGLYGARLVTMDFLDQRAWLDARSFVWPKVKGITPPPAKELNVYTALTPIPGDRPGGYASPADHALLHWGTHLVPLKVAAKTVSVSLTGGTSANDAAWRFALVAVAPGDVATYSPLGRADGTDTGSTALRVPVGTRLYLAVTATPYSYKHVPTTDVGGAYDQTVFPYRVRVTGAVVAGP